MKTMKTNQFIVNDNNGEDNENTEVGEDPFKYDNINTANWW